MIIAEQPHFLRLPYTIRLRIYRETGLVSHREIDVSTPYAPGEWSSRQKRLSRKHQFRPQPWLPNQLFFVSRSISEDARRTFYSQNRFLFQWGADYGLRSLSNMGRIGWESLRCFAIRIGANPCLVPNVPGCHGSPWHILENDSQLEKNGLLDMWKHTCHQLATHIKQDDLLEIHLTCDAASRGTLAALLEPLLELPRLKELSVRAGPLRDFQLQQALMETMGKKTRLFVLQRRSGVFRFFDLPLELQVCILDFTELVTPKPLILISWHKRFIPWDCYHGICNARRRPYRSYQGCWCPATHTAFSTADPCWQLSETRYYLVNKRMRELALSVHYSKNIFEVWYNFIDSPYTAWSPQTSGFLYGFPEYSWKYLRRVHWVLLSSPLNAFYPDQRETLDWTNAMEVVSQSFNLSKFTLELSLSPSTINRRTPEDRSKFARKWKLYDRIIEPLRSLNGLKDFFVHNYFPMHETQEETRINQERVLERRVMGSEYDSMARGKTYSKPLEPIDYDY